MVLPSIFAILAWLSLLHWRTGEGFVVIPKSAARNPQGVEASPSLSSSSLHVSSFLDAVDPLVLEKVAKDVAIGGALAFAGDVIAQSLTSDSGENKSIPPQDWDTVRTAALTTFGALYTGGAQHFVFGFLNSHFSDPITRLLLAQFCFIPFCYYPTFLLMVPTLRAWACDDFAMERSRLAQEVLGRLPATLLRNWCFWLPVQYGQFFFIPPDLQVTYCAAFGVIWNAILSWSTMQTTQEDQAKKET